MNEHKFLQELQKRADEQQKLINHMPFPRFFTVISVWLGIHPWRILIPFAFLLTLLFHTLFGQRYDDLILKIFGSL